MPQVCVLPGYQLHGMTEKGTIIPGMQGDIEIFSCFQGAQDKPAGITIEEGLAIT